jgi:hypothetical protein
MLPDIFEGILNLGLGIGYLVAPSIKGISINNLPLRAHQLPHRPYPFKSIPVTLIVSGHRD